MHLQQIIRKLVASGFPKKIYLASVGLITVQLGVMHGGVADICVCHADDTPKINVLAFGQGYVELKGNVIRVIPHVQNLETCAKHCEMDSACTHWRRCAGVPPPRQGLTACLTLRLPSDCRTQMVTMHRDVRDNLLTGVARCLSQEATAGYSCRSAS